ncbi:MAG TPA: rhomboid family intramembrane serine protease [Bryobacteraceae bacterium]|nr:rhomboid family intramembrane serine protease [Bryobacteraceae bacterium]
MCPNCRAFIGSGDRVCPYCGQQLGPRVIDMRQPKPILGGLIPHAQFTTILILVINIAFYIATTLVARNIGSDAVTLWAFGGKFGPKIYGEHEWWRLVTAGFLHGNLLHIAMDSLSLFYVGAQVEMVYGTPRYLVIYFVGTITGFWLSLMVNPMGLSIGSSAGITGLIGAMVAFGVVNRSAVGRAIRNSYVSWIVYILAIGFIGGFGTDNWAHIGGIIGGFVVGFVAGTPMRSTREREAMWRVLATACLLVTVFCFWQVYTHFPPPDQLR